MQSYTLFEPIASGGMGTVHYGRADGATGLSRIVAIKRMHGELARDAACIAMFHEELRLATRVRHPNVVATLDVVVHDHELWLVMDCVQGVSLQELIAQVSAMGGRIPPSIAISIVCGMLQGLHAAHEARGPAGEPLGIVHRDVSPENILIGRDGIARLLDFGIARGVGRKHVTRVGEVKGKPSYLAPEQILDGTRIDRRADIWGASVVLWEALTGRRLFDSDSVAGILSQVLTAPIEPPSALAGPLPEGLDALVLRGLNRDPEQRFSTTLDLARELRRVCGNLLPFEVGEWLEVIAASALAKQSREVRRIESSAPAVVAEEVEPAPTWVELAAVRLIERPKLRKLMFGAAVAIFGFAAGLATVSTALAHH